MLSNWISASINEIRNEKKLRISVTESGWTRWEAQRLLVGWSKKGLERNLAEVRSDLQGAINVASLKKNRENTEENIENDHDQTEEFIHLRNIDKGHYYNLFIPAMTIGQLQWPKREALERAFQPSRGIFMNVIRKGKLTEQISPLEITETVGISEKGALKNWMEKKISHGIGKLKLFNFPFHR